MSDENKESWRIDGGQDDADKRATIGYAGSFKLPDDPQRRRVRRILMMTIIISVAISAASMIFVMKFNRAAKTEDATTTLSGNPQSGPADRPTAGYGEAEKPGQRNAEGLKPPRPEDGIDGSTKVALATVEVSGGGAATRGDVENVLRRSYGRMGFAYMDYARAHGVTTAEDTVVIRFRVSDAGAVEDEEILKNTTGDAALAKAVTDALSRAVFPAGPGGATVTATYAFRARMAAGE